MGSALVGTAVAVALCALTTGGCLLRDAHPIYGSPRFSPDGRTIAAVRTGERLNDGSAVVLIDVATGEERELSGSDDFHASFEWASDGRLAYTDYRDRNGNTCWDEEETQCSTNAEIYVRDAEGHHSTRITRSDANDAWPRWIDEGRRIVFWSNRACNPRLDPKSPTYELDRRLLCVEPDRPYVADSAGRLASVPYNGRHLLPYVGGPWGDSRGRVYATGKDRNGRTCHGYDSDRRCSWRGELYLRRPGKSSLRLTRTHADERQPSLSPDRRTIVFIRDRQVATMNIDGSGLDVLTQ